MMSDPLQRTNIYLKIVKSEYYQLKFTEHFLCQTIVLITLHDVTNFHMGQLRQRSDWS